MSSETAHPLSEVSCSPLAGTGLIATGTITPVTADGRVHETATEQIQVVWARLAATLHRHGSDPSRIVKLSIQISEGSAIAPVRSHLDERLGTANPAIVMTGGVMIPGVFVQLDALAATSLAATTVAPSASELVEQPHLMAVDPEAAAADGSAPAFVAAPVGSEVYHGFPVLDIPDRDGWRLGAVSGFGDGSREGDAFVVAPDGSRAGVVWTVGTPVVCSALLPADAERWGVFAITVPQPMGARGELVENLAAIVGELAIRWETLRDPAQS